MSIPSYDATSVAPEDKTMGMVAYILAIFTSWLGPLILFLVKKDQSKFVAFHSMQALVLVGAIFVVGVVANVLSAVLGSMHLGAIGLILILAASLIGFGGFVLNILAAIAASKGQWYEMPVVGAYAKRFVGV